MVKWCADPLRIHKIQYRNTKDLRVISSDLFKICKEQLAKDTVLCSRCRKLLKDDPQLLKKIKEPSSSDSQLSESESCETKSISDEEVPTEVVHTYLKEIGVTPVKKHSTPHHSIQKKGSEALVKAHRSLKNKLEASLSVKIPSPDKSQEESVTAELLRYRNLMQELVEAYKQTSSKEKKLQLLSLSPYTKDETIRRFGSTDYMVKKSRKLKKEYGVIPTVPDMSKGKVITEDMKLAVKCFYESDDISRMCPGKKDCRVVRDDGEKVTRQKRLILMNLREAYKLFKDDKKNPRLGFSSFAYLRPLNCVLAGTGGTHSVCVCTYHQNSKLQISALHIKDLTYKVLIEKTVCSMDNQNCMMRHCKSCPGKDGLKNFIDGLKDMESQPEEIKYKQWVSIDRCTLLEKTESLDEFITSLTEKIIALSRHHYIAQSQSIFLKELKASLPENELIIIGDFSENYSFIIQDAAQGFHWENSQCTIHPFVVYWRDFTENSTRSASYCFISPDTRHTTTMVYCFIEQLIPIIKDRWPQVSKLHYFSDGCAAQYKNRYNFTNICCHKKDFGLSCEWHFFATSHGKNACDGIGGTIKRATARASLQRHLDNQIITARTMFQFCEDNLSQHIKFFYVTHDDVERSSSKIEERFRKSVPIVGTQRFHKYVPFSETQINVFHLSADIAGEKRSLVKSSRLRLKEKVDELLSVKIGDYIVCKYESAHWVGIVKEYHEEYNDFSIDFLYPSGYSKYYHFPTSRDNCIVPQENITGVLNTPNLNQGTSRIQYNFLESEVQQFM